jgi:starch synthase
VDVDADAGRGNGFLFEDPTPDALLEAMLRAIAAYRDAARWTTLRDRVMGLDHSWARPAGLYIDAYRDAIARHAGAAGSRG